MCVCVRGLCDGGYSSGGKKLSLFVILVTAREQTDYDLCRLGSLQCPDLKAPLLLL